MHVLCSVRWEEASEFGLKQSGFATPTPHLSVDVFEITESRPRTYLKESTGTELRAGSVTFPSEERCRHRGEARRNPSACPLP